MMTEEERIHVGLYCEELLGDETFNMLVEQYQMQSFVHFKDSAAPNVKEREHIYAKLQALQDFLIHVRAFVTDKDAILKAMEPSLEDAPLDGVD